MRGSGITLKINDIPAKIMMDQFLIEADVKSVGALDTNMNNEAYNYLTINNAVSTPWYQSNPINQLDFTEGYLKLSDVLLVYPTDPKAQEKIQLMQHSEAVIFYLERFAVRGDLSMGSDMLISGVLDSLDKRFLALTGASVFPMFPARTSMPQNMPIVLLNRDKISHYHPVSAEE
jgi:hypothetical protein